MPSAPVAAGTSRALSAQGTHAAGESVFRVRVVDGRNGTPIENAHVRLWYDERGDAGYLLMTNSQGIAVMPEPVGLPLRILLLPEDRLDCRKPSTDDPAPGYNLQAIAATGLSGVNRCGPVQVKPNPGEVVLFARPLRWYEGRINRGTPQ